VYTDVFTLCRGYYRISRYVFRYTYPRQATHKRVVESSVQTGRGYLNTTVYDQNSRVYRFYQPVKCNYENVWTMQPADPMQDHWLPATDVLYHKFRPVAPSTANHITTNVYDANPQIAKMDANATRQPRLGSRQSADRAAGCSRYLTTMLMTELRSAIIVRHHISTVAVRSRSKLPRA